LDQGRLHVEVSVDAYQRVLNQLLETEGVIRACVDSRSLKSGRYVRISADIRGPSREYLANSARRMRRSLNIRSMTLSIGTQQYSNRGWARLAIPDSGNLPEWREGQIKPWLPEESDWSQEIGSEYQRWSRYQYDSFPDLQPGGGIGREESSPETVGEIALDLVSRILAAAVAE